MKVISITAAILAPLLIAAGAVGQEATKPRVPAPPAQTKQAPGQGSGGALLPMGKQFVGEVVAVEPESRSLIGQEPGGQKQFDLSSASLMGYQSIAQIRVGDRVAILYEERGGKAVASAVAKQPQVKGFAGQVAKVDTEAKVIVVSGPKGEAEFDAMKVGLKGYRSLKEIKPGDSIVVAYTERDGRKQATTIVRQTAQKQ